MRNSRSAVTPARLFFTPPVGGRSYRPKNYAWYTSDLSRSRFGSFVEDYSRFEIQVVPAASSAKRAVFSDDKFEARRRCELGVAAASRHHANPTRDASGSASRNLDAACGDGSRRQTSVGSGRSAFRSKGAGGGRNRGECSRDPKRNHPRKAPAWGATELF